MMTHTGWPEWTGHDLVPPVAHGGRSQINGYGTCEEKKTEVQHRRSVLSVHQINQMIVGTSGKMKGAQQSSPKQRVYIQC